MAMTKKFLDALNIPSMNDIFGDDAVDDEDVTSPPSSSDDVAVPSLSPVCADNDFVEGRDHADKMDEIHRQTLQHAAELMEFGYNAEPNRSRGFFEIAASMYGRAIEASNSKRESQLKAMRLALIQRKQELDAKTETQTFQSTGNGDVVIVEDRNALLRRLANERDDEP